MSRVSVSEGLLQGLSEDGVLKFLGIPYASPPTAERRWCSPLPAVPWSGVRLATNFGPICPQTIGACFNVRQPTQSEDCLYLNVWTRRCDALAKRPVMVWIHGGGFFGGAGSEDGYDGSHLALRDVVLVTFNYRLGAFGFLARPEVGANFGIEDQIAPLRWVQANIISFGGDPGKVTVFGESAGAHSIRTLMSCPGAYGLFHRVILESAGFGDPAIFPSQSFDRTWQASETLFNRLGTHDLSKLRAIPTDVIRDASHELCGVPPPPGRIHTPANLIWRPVLDGKIVQEGFPGCPSNVPVIMGCVENEARYFLKPSGSYNTDVLEKLAHNLYGHMSSRALEYLESLDLTLYERIDKLFTTAIFSEPALHSARKFAALGYSVYHFHFNRCTPGARLTNDLVKHTSEIRYIFGTLTEDRGHDHVDEEISQLMQSAWISFALNGVPTSLDGHEWPVYREAEPLTAWIENDLTIRPFPSTDLISLLNLLRLSVCEQENV